MNGVYNEPTKINFIRKIKDGLYQSHQELLSNPLLATMMLMTFEEFAEIPSKMHIFYRSAFEVLFRRHDATKVDFHREFKTELSIDDFEKVFSTFCLMSYLDSVHSFPDNATIIRYVDKAIQYEGISAASNDLRDDLTDNICIVLHDGEQFAFLHRSFQEYFSAFFLANRSVEAFADVVDAVSRKDFNLAVLKFLFEMNREVVERIYLIPRLKSVIADLKEALDKKNYKAALALFYSSAIVEFDTCQGSFSISMNEVPSYFQLINIVNNLYRPDLFAPTKVSATTIEEFKKKAQPMGTREQAIMPIDKLTSEMLSGAQFDRHVRKILSVLEDLLLKAIKEESERKTLLSEALLGSKKKR